MVAILVSCGKYQSGGSGILVSLLVSPLFLDNTGRLVPGQDLVVGTLEKYKTNRVGCWEEKTPGSPPAQL